MRLPILTAILFLCCFTLVNAQTSGDCRTAIPVCADAPISSFADGAGDVEDFDPETEFSSGCLEKGSISSSNIENNTAWYVFRAGADGQVGFDIEALSATAEWDFAVYGPDTDCAAIGDGTVAPVIRCNYEVNETGFTGLGVNPISGQEGGAPTVGSQNTYDEYLDVREGEIYYILINNYNTNFDGDPEPFSLTFTGTTVDEDQNTALDCTFRDEFLGVDISACEGDEDIILSALRSPAGADISSVTWTVDYDDDGVIDATLPGTGAFGAELAVSSPNSGRYFVDIQTTLAQNYTDDILITYYATPVLDRVELLNSNITNNPDENNIEIFVDGDGSYEYAINGGDFQDDPIFLDVPPGENTLVINDKNGCGTTEPIPFFVLGFPKFFTPNGDGVHDLWNIMGIEDLDEPVVYVFDRYGKLLKQMSKYDIGWDGTFNGKKMPESDYWFRLEYEESVETAIVAKTTKNHFSLVR